MNRVYEFLGRIHASFEMFLAKIKLLLCQHMIVNETHKHKLVRVRLNNEFFSISLEALILLPCNAYELLCKKGHTFAYVYDIMQKLNKLYHLIRTKSAILLISIISRTRLRNIRVSRCNIQRYRISCIGRTNILPL